MATAGNSYRGPVLIRPATTADVDGIGAVHGHASRVAYAGLPPAELPRTPTADTRSAPDAPDRHTLVADDAGTILGFTTFGPARNHASGAGEVYALSLHPDHARHRTGRRLLAAAEDGLRADGYRSAVLWVLTGNTAARAFHTATGWTADGTTSTDRAGAPMVRYARRLPQRTARLRLDPIGPHRLDDLVRLHTDPGVVRAYGRWTVADVREFARRCADGWRADGAHKWIAEDGATGTVLGRGGLSYREVGAGRQLEVGWTVLERFRGNGYATEIGAAALAVAFDELGADEVVAFTETENVRSLAVMERLGFTDFRPIRHRGAPFMLGRRLPY